MLFVCCIVFCVMVINIAHGQTFNDDGIQSSTAMTNSTAIKLDDLLNDQNSTMIQQEKLNGSNEDHESTKSLNEDTADTTVAAKFYDQFRNLLNKYNENLHKSAKSGSINASYINSGSGMLRNNETKSNHGIENIDTTYSIEQATNNPTVDKAASDFLELLNKHSSIKTVDLSKKGSGKKSNEDQAATGAFHQRLRQHGTETRIFGGDEEDEDDIDLDDDVLDITNQMRWSMLGMAQQQASHQ